MKSVLNSVMVKWKARFLPVMLCNVIHFLTVQKLTHYVITKVPLTNHSNTKMRCWRHSISVRGTVTGIFVILGGQKLNWDNIKRLLKRKNESQSIFTYLINQTGEGLAKTTTTTNNNKQTDPTFQRWNTFPSRPYTSSTLVDGIYPLEQPPSKKLDH